MPWVDFKSGFALVGSLVVLVGSIVTRRNSMRPENPGDPGGSAVRKEPDGPEPLNPSEFLTGTDHDVKVSKPRPWKKNPPTASA